MLRDAAVDFLMARLGQRGDTALRQDIIDEMDFVQENILERMPDLPWFLRTSATTVTVTSQGYVDLPTDFLAFPEEGGVWLEKETDGEWKQLTDEEFQVAFNTWDDRVGNDGEPELFSLISDSRINLYPVPDAVYTIQFEYMAKAADISGAYGGGNNVENAWLKHAADLFIAEAGFLVATQRLQSEKMGAIFSAQAQRAKLALMRKHNSMLEGTKMRTMGDD